MITVCSIRYLGELCSNISIESMKKFNIQNISETFVCTIHFSASKKEEKKIESVSWIMENFCITEHSRAKWVKKGKLCAKKYPEHEWDLFASSCVLLVWCAFFKISNI